MGCFLKGNTSLRPFFWVVPGFLWELLFFYIPLALMIILSFTYVTDTYQHVSFARYSPFFTKAYFLIILKSLILACVNGIVCFLIGYPMAYFLAFKTGRLKLFFLFLLIVPFWVNFLLHVYAWFFVLDQGGIINSSLLMLGIIDEPLHLLNSMFAIIVVMVYCYLPFMVLPIYSSLARFNQTLLEASRDLGATDFETWYHIVLPLSLSGVASGFALVFIPSFGEFAIPGLMGGEKFVFVGSVITQYALGAQTMPFGTAFTVMCFCALILFMLMGYGLKRLLARGVDHGS